MFDWEKIPAASWEQSVPDALKETVRDRRATFCAAIEKAFLDTINASPVSFHGPIDQTQANLAIFDVHGLTKLLPASDLRRFNDLAVDKEPSAIFAAYFELLRATASLKAEDFFRKLLEIGEAHADKIGGDYSVWAANQTRHLIRSHPQAFVIWVIHLCNQGEEYTEDKSQAFQLICGRVWLAPRFLVMEPSPIAYEPFDGKRAWDRIDFKTSVSELNRLAECFFQRAYNPVEQAAKDYRAEMAAEGAKATPDISREVVKPQKRQSMPTYGRREQVIFGAIQAGLKGREYCAKLSEQGLPVSENRRNRGWPSSYLKAYGNEERRQLINDEKAKMQKKYNKLSAQQISRIIEGRFD